MRQALVLVLALALGGCAVMKGADAPTTLRLVAPAADMSGAMRGEGSVALMPVGATGLAGSQRYTYTLASAPAELHQARTIFWEEPPAAVLGRALAASLRLRFAAVSGPADRLPADRLPADRRVSAVLTRFEERQAGGAATAVVAFDASVVGKAVSVGSYCGTAPIAGASGTERARAFEAAMADAAARFAADVVAGTLRSKGCLGA